MQTVAAARFAPLAETVWPADAPQARALRAGLLAVLGSALVALSAQISIPFWPVPLTMQTLAVLAVGIAYGRTLGAATIALYLLEGFVGLPVFANGASGPAYMAGPTGGYLVGFAFAAGVAGALSEQGWDRTPARTAAAMLVGNLTIYLFGVTWLTQFLARARNTDLTAGLLAALNFGVRPFLLGDGLKILLAVALFYGAWRMVGPRERT